MKIADATSLHEPGLSRVHRNETLGLSGSWSLGAVDNATSIKRRCLTKAAMVLPYGVLEIGIGICSTIRSNQQGSS